MADYKGNTCPVCHNLFAEGDDIVVCPDCGTPYHRACWQKVGVCVHQAEHASGFEWRPDKAPASDEPVCPNCGTHNPPGARFCNHCGVPLPDPEAASAQEPEEPTPVYARSNAPGSNAPGEGFAAGIYRKELGPDDPIEGIKARDWATFVGNSSLYYLMQFFRMEETRHKVSVCFSALFLGPIYFFYRKMWKEGVIFTLLTAVLALPTVIYLLALSQSPLVSGLPGGNWLYILLNVCAVLDWVQMILRCLFAVYWYKKDSAQKIRAIYDQVPDGPAREDALALSGGTSVAGVVVYLAVYLAAIALIVRMMGPNMQAVLSLVSL